MSMSKARFRSRLPEVWFALALILALALIGMPAGAEADGSPEAPEGLDISFSVSPGELVAPGDITMTFILTNGTRYDIQNITIVSADGLLSEPIGQIGAGETQTLARPHTVTQAELDDGEIRYPVIHDPVTPGGEKVTHALSAPIAKGDARPNVDFTRQLSSTHIAPGGQLTITYKLTNNGNVPATAISVRDTLGDFTGRLEQLPVGATKSFISRVMVSSDTASQATLEYTVPSGERFERKLDPVPIHLSAGALEASFSVGRSAFDTGTADAILTLTNTGSDNYVNIAVLDDVYGGVIADSISLPSGESPFEIAYTYPVRGDGEYRWRVTGQSESGVALDFKTDTLTLEAEPPSRDILATLSATARTPRISRAGYVTFDIEIVNEGSAMASGLRLYEVSRGDVRNIAVLPTGEPTHCQARYEVTGDSQFIFCLNYTDADGRPRTISAAPLDVTIGPGGEAPETAEGQAMNLEGESVKIGSTSTFTVLLLIASAALISMFTILLVTSLRARQDRRKRLAAERQRIKEELGKTNPFTPVKAKKRRRRTKAYVPPRRKKQ